MPQIKTITVHAGRTFNHPHESYSNFKPGISITAEIQEGEDPDKIIIDLQAKAEKSAEDIKNNILKNIEEMRELTSLQREVRDLERSLKDGAERLQRIRENHPSLSQTQLQIGTQTHEDTQF